jgi:hypothetical protein
MRSMILGLLLLTANVAHAETGDDVFTIGVGHNSCGQLIAAIGNTPLGKHEEAGTSRGVVVNEYAMYLQWLGGFVSGYNATKYSEKQPQVRGVEAAGMDLWMRNWCNEHPTQKVIVGAIAFINEMLANAAGRN